MFSARLIGRSQQLDDDDLDQDADKHEQEVGKRAQQDLGGPEGLRAFRPPECER
jgi:hypothetical protein